MGSIVSLDVSEKMIISYRILRGINPLNLHLSTRWS